MIVHITVVNRQTICQARTHSLSFKLGRTCMPRFGSISGTDAVSSKYIYLWGTYLRPQWLRCRPSNDKLSPTSEVHTFISPYPSQTEDPPRGDRPLRLARSEVPTQPVLLRSVSCHIHSTSLHNLLRFGRMPIFDDETTDEDDAEVPASDECIEPTRTLPVVARLSFAAREYFARAFMT